MTLDTLTAPPADPTAPKDWWRSLTLWFNVISAAVVIGGVFVDPSLGFDPRVVALATAIITAGNAALRVLKTSAPIAGTPAAAQAQTAKDALVMHAIDAVAVPAPAVVPNSDDLVQRLREFKQRHDADTAVLAQFAAVAAGPSVASTGVPPVLTATNVPP